MTSWPQTPNPKRHIPNKVQFQKGGPVMVTVCDRQKLRKVDTRLLKKIAAAARSESAPYQRTRTGRAGGLPCRSHPGGGRFRPATPSSLTIVLVDDAQMTRLNRQFHHTAGPTDILTFDYGESAELIISIETAAREARRYRSRLARELALYVVHGILHLAGYDDRTPRQRARMRRAQRRVLAVIARRR